MRTLYLLLIATLVFLFTGCGGGTKEKPTGTQSKVLSSQKSGSGFDQVVQSTGSQKETESFEELLHRLETADQGMQRGVAARKLGELKDPRAVDALCKRLLEDPFPFCRAHCVRALASIGDPRALPALRQAAQSDQKDDIRNLAKTAIKQIEDRQASGK